MTLRRLRGVAAIIAGAAGCTAFLMSASTGMRDLLRAHGGFCVSGQPGAGGQSYVTGNACAGGDLRLLVAGMLGGLVATVIMCAGTVALGQSGASAGLLAWISLFGALGWTFISLAVHAPAGLQGAGRWLVTGVVFWLLAVGALLPFLAGVVTNIRIASRTSPAYAGHRPLVPTAFVPVMANGEPGGFTRDWLGGGQIGCEARGQAGGPAGGAGSSRAGGGDRPGAAGALAARGRLGGAGRAGASGGGAGWAGRRGGVMTSGRPAHNPGVVHVGLWLVALLAGGELGLAASHALVTMLR